MERVIAIRARRGIADSVVNEIFGIGEKATAVCKQRPSTYRTTEARGCGKRLETHDVEKRAGSKVPEDVDPESRALCLCACATASAFIRVVLHPILAHELMHGLGPHNIKVGGQDTTVRKQLKELSSAFERSEGCITGLWALQISESTRACSTSKWKARFTQRFSRCVFVQCVLA
jgi:hypothetical protein